MFIRVAAERIDVGGRNSEKVRKFIEETELIDGIIVKGKEDKELPYIPHGELRDRIFKALHGDPLAGHLSYPVTLKRIQDRFYWPGMNKDIKDKCRKCHSCNVNKPRVRNKVPFRPLRVSGPWQDVHVDFCQLPESPDGYSYVLAIRDRFTRSCELVPCKKADSITAARKFRKRVLKRHGHPITVVTDGGKHFEKHFDEMLKDECIRHEVGLPYVHNSNAVAERVIRSMEEYLRHYVDSDTTNWKKYIADCQFSINTARSFSTGISPFKLEHGRLPNTRIENEVYYKVDPDEEFETISDSMLTSKKQPGDYGEVAILRDVTLELDDEEITESSLLNEEYIKKNNGDCAKNSDATQDKATERTSKNDHFVPEVGDLVDICRPSEARNDCNNKWYGPYKVLGLQKKRNNNLVLVNPFVGDDSKMVVHVADVSKHRGEGIRREVIPQDEPTHDISKYTKAFVKMIVDKLKKNINDVSAIDLIGKKVQVYWSQTGARGWWTGIVIDYEPYHKKHWIKYEIKSDDGTTCYLQDMLGTSKGRWRFCG